MLTAIARYGARMHPTTRQIVAACRERGEFIKGPQVAAFEQAFAARLGARHAVGTSYGRTALYFILEALKLPLGSEIILPALTSWTVPELARAAGLRVRFADVDPVTFCMDPAALSRAITDKTRAVVPTHLFGLPCDMDAILELAGRHNLAVIEDCAHAMGAAYRGRAVGTFGDGALFSFRELEPLRCCGGGMAVVRDAPVAARLRERVEALPWPHEKRIANRLLAGRLVRVFTRPRMFAVAGLPARWAASLAGALPGACLREKIRPLTPLPDGYLERFTNVQAALGLASLDLLDGWTAATRSHAHALGVALGDIPGVRVPVEPAERTHVYYRYCVEAPTRADVIRRCRRRGVDVELRHVSVCPQLALFADERVQSPGAERAARAIQVPVAASLTDRQARRVTGVVRNALEATSATPRRAEAVRT